MKVALREAGCLRFRPVFLTSVTTVGGLLPLLFDKSFQAQFLIPMATSMVFGEMVTTVLILVLLPVAYSFIGGAGPVDDHEEMIPQESLANPDEGDDEWLPDHLKVGAKAVSHSGSPTAGH